MIKNITFKGFIKWCNNRACDGNWGCIEALTCLDLIQQVKKIPFWKRNKYWKKNFEVKVLEEIINPIELKRDNIKINKKR